MIVGLFIALVLCMVGMAVAFNKANNEILTEKGGFSEELRIKIEYPGNTSFCYIHLSDIIYSGDSYLSRTGNPDEEYPEICHKLIQVPGVTEISAQKYEISLEKGEVFTFEDDILPKALEIIKEHYGNSRKIIILETEDRRENARLQAEIENDFRRRTGRDPYEDMW